MAGAARTVITPPTGYTMGAWGLRQGRSTGVHRDLYSRAVVLHDGENSIAIVSMDVAGIPKDVLTSIQTRIHRLAGIPPNNVLISSTHNHTTPDFINGVTPELRLYATIFGELVSGTVVEASHAMVPVRVGYGWGDLPGVNEANSSTAVEHRCRNGTPTIRWTIYACSWR